MNNGMEKAIELVSKEIERRNRLEILFFNSIKLIDINFLKGCMTLEEKLKFLKYELGLTDQEIEELDIINECELDS